MLLAAGSVCAGPDDAPSSWVARPAVGQLHVQFLEAAFGGACPQFLQQRADFAQVAGDLPAARAGLSGQLRSRRSRPQLAGGLGFRPRRATGSGAARHRVAAPGSTRALRDSSRSGPGRAAALQVSISAGAPAGRPARSPARRSSRVPVTAWPTRRRRPARLQPARGQRLLQLAAVKQPCNQSATSAFWLASLRRSRSARRGKAGWRRPGARGGCRRPAWPVARAPAKARTIPGADLQRVSVCAAPPQGVFSALLERDLGPQALQPPRPCLASQGATVGRDLFLQRTKADARRQVGPARALGVHIPLPSAGLRPVAVPAPAIRAGASVSAASRRAVAAALASRRSSGAAGLSASRRSRAGQLARPLLDVALGRPAPDLPPT